MSPRRACRRRLASSSTTCENVDGAREAGLIGVHYVDTPALIADLGRLGVEVPMSEGR